jgi:sterol desaturase/sphingolipid hydroxylase (fatty acid hydroxylase superfamily)
VELFNDFLNWLGFDNIVAIEISSWPKWLQLLLLFILADFIQWTVHILLHRVPWLWEFHKVHHSVKEMGFAAHLRFHWMEKIIYNTIQYIPLAMIGFGIQEFLLVHLFALAIGHFNHSNIRVPLGPFKYIFNNPQMHIWHHAKHIPSKTGVNFGISLSIWDYLFRTNYIPKDGKDEPLGFDDMDQFPTNLKDQLVHGLNLRKKR